MIINADPGFEQVSDFCFLLNDWTGGLILEVSELIVTEASQVLLCQLTHIPLLHVAERH